MQSAKRAIRTILIGLALVCMLATPALAAAYYTDVAVQNSSGVDYARLPIMCGDVKAKLLATNGYMSATGLDTRVESGACPHMLADGGLLFARAMPAGSSSLSEFTTGNSALSNFYTLTGYDGHITILDNAQLELDNSFEIEQRGYVDTTAGSNKNLIYKDGAISIFVSGSGNITAQVGGTINRQVAASADDCHLRRQNVSLFSTVSNYCAAGNWDANQFKFGCGMRFTNIAIPQGATIDTAYLILTCNLAASNMTVNTKISAEDVDNAGDFSGDNATTFDARFANHTAARVDWNNIPAWSLDESGPDTTSPEIKTVIQEIVDRPGFSSGNSIVLFWEDFDNNSDVGASRWSYSYDHSTTKCAQLYVEVEPFSITTTGISSGVRKIVTSDNTTHLTISVYNESGVLIDMDSAAFTDNVTDSANNWLINQNNVMPYMEYLKITTVVGGTSEKLWYQPNDYIHGQLYTAGTVTFTNGSTAVTGNTTSWTSAMDGSMIWSATDLIGHTVSSVIDATHLTLTANYSGAGGAGHNYTMAPRLPDRDTVDGYQDGAITWGTNATGVSVYADALAAVAVAVGGEGVVSPPPDVAPEMGEPEGMYPTEGEMSGEALVWLHPIVSDAAQRTSTPLVLIWYLICAVYVLLFMAAIHRFVPNMLLTGIGGLVAIGTCVAMAFLPSWFIILVTLFIIALIVMERSPSI